MKRESIVHPERRLEIQSHGFASTTKRRSRHRLQVNLLEKRTKRSRNVSVLQTEMVAVRILISCKMELRERDNP